MWYNSNYINYKYFGNIKVTILKIYNTLVLPTFLYGSEKL